MLPYAPLHSSYPLSVPGIYFLALPNVLTASALYGFGGHLLGQLLFADRARFGHHVCHEVAPPVPLLCLLMCTRRARNSAHALPEKLSDSVASTFALAGKYRICGNADLLGRSPKLPVYRSADRVGRRGRGGLRLVEIVAALPANKMPARLSHVSRDKALTREGSGSRKKMTDVSSPLT
jgi:hypothetical protein